MTTTWLDFVHPVYAANIAAYRFARDHYTGAVVDDGVIDTYLARRTIGEAPEAYDERKALADYTPHFGALVDSLAGMLFGNETDASRTWGALARENTPTDGPLAGIYDDAGDGVGYLTVWKRLAIELTAIHRAWLLVDGGSATTRPRLRVIAAEHVPNWLTAPDGRVVEVLVKEAADMRASVEDDPALVDQWVRFTTTGWTRYRKDAEDKTPVVLDTGTYRYEDPVEPVRLILPIFPVDLALPRNVGYLLARKANAIFNQESARDNLLRQANFPFLNVFGSDATFDKVVAAIKAGSRALQNMVGSSGHTFAAPPSEPAAIATDVLKRKVEEFWRTGFREYEDAAIEKSATEVRQDVASGVGAYLTLLKASVDDAENRMLGLLEQTFFPGDRAKWGAARVARSDDFVPFDINQTIERLRTRYFGPAGLVPASRAARVEAARQIAEWDGLDTDAVGIGVAVDATAIAGAFDALRELPIPAEGRAELAVRVLEAIGYDVTAVPGGRDALVATAAELAGASDTNAMRSAAALGGSGFMPQNSDASLQSPEQRAAAERNLPPDGATA